MVNTPGSSFLAVSLLYLHKAGCQAYTTALPLSINLKTSPSWTSLVVQWLRLHASTAGSWVWSLVGEVPHTIWCSQKNLKKQNNNNKKTPSALRMWSYHNNPLLLLHLCLLLSSLTPSSFSATNNENVSRGFLYWEKPNLIQRALSSLQKMKKNQLKCPHSHLLPSLESYIKPKGTLTVKYL